MVAGKAAGHEWRGSKVVFEDAEESAKPPTTDATPDADAAILPEESLPKKGISGIVSSKQLRKLTCQILKKVTTSSEKGLSDGEEKEDRLLQALALS